VALSGASARATASATVYYAEPAWSPDGKHIAFVDHTRQALYVANADGTHIRTLPVEAQAGNPGWSPDGRKIVFHYGYDGIGVINANGRGLRRLSDSGCCPDWSPRGRKIAYSDGSDFGPGYIYVMNRDGTHQELVARPRRNEQSLSMPSWSPDGQRLAFCVCVSPDSPDVGTSLGLISSYRGRIRYLVEGAEPWDPDWSPEGARIAFSDGYVEVRVLNFRTGRVYDLQGGEHPRWSPNGRKLVYADHGLICEMNANGSHAHVVVGTILGKLDRRCLR
jgi:Tol biopolymer transport system component